MPLRRLIRLLRTLQLPKRLPLMLRNRLMRRRGDDCMMWQDQGIFGQTAGFALTLSSQTTVTESRRNRRT